MGTVTELPERRPRLLVTTKEAAEQLSICTKTLSGLLRAGVIPTVQIGSKRLIAQTDLNAYVDQLRADALPYADTAS